GLPAGGCRAADAATQWDAHARDLPLERTEHQLVAVRQVETGPVEIGQLMEQEGGELGRVGDEVALTTEQRLQLGLQQRVAVEPLATSGQIDHDCCSSSCRPTQ